MKPLSLRVLRLFGEMGRIGWTSMRYSRRQATNQPNGGACSTPSTN